MKRSIAEILEQNVFYALMAATITSAGVTYAVTKNLTDDVASQKIAEVKIEKDRQIEELQRIINSMNRVIGEDFVQFDILSMQVPRGQISQIPPSYHSIMANRIFIPDVLPNSWKGEETNWYDAEKMTTPGLETLTPGDPLATTIRSIPAYILRVGGEAIKVSCPTIWGRPALFYFAPTIQFRIMKLDDVSKILLLQTSEIDRSEEQAGFDSLEKRIDILKKNKPLNSKSNKNERSILEEIYLAESLIAKLVSPAFEDYALDSIVKIKNNFPDAYRGTKVYIDSIQKRNNVLYAKITLEFNAAIVNERPGGRAVIHQETIFFGYGDHAVIINTLIPTTDGRSPHFSTVNAFVNGVKILF